MRQQWLQGNARKVKQANFRAVENSTALRLAHEPYCRNSIIVGTEAKETHRSMRKGRYFSEHEGEAIPKKILASCAYWFVELLAGAGLGYQNSAGVHEEEWLSEKTFPTSS